MAGPAGGPSLDGGLGEGHTQVVVLAQVMVVQVDEGLDGLLHGAHLDQRHLAVLPGRQGERVGWGPQDVRRWDWGHLGREGEGLCSLEELESLHDPAIAGKERLEVIL